MRAAVIYFAEKRKKELEAMSKALAGGMEKQNISVDVFNAKDFNRRLAIYQLVVLGTEATGSFGGKIPEGLAKYLESVGPVVNVRSFAFVVKKGMRTQKSLQALMKTMEREGMVVIYSDLLENEAAAAAAGEKLIINN